MIWVASRIWMAWLISYQIVNNSASVIVTLIAWWIILILLDCKWICKMDIVMLFLILASEIIMTEFGYKEVFAKILLSL